MSLLRPFRATDLLKFNNINLDIWTETYSISFYLNYLSRWPDLCCVQESPSGRLMGYVFGKAEGQSTEWHGHVTAITVAPPYRRLGLAGKMMDLLELVSDRVYHGYFVDLYVRCNNAVAIGMYERMGYSVYRRVVGYYDTSTQLDVGGQDAEDAFGELWCAFSGGAILNNRAMWADMRKPLSRDVNRNSIRSHGRQHLVEARTVS